MLFNVGVSVGCNAGVVVCGIMCEDGASRVDVSSNKV